MDGRIGTDLQRQEITTYDRDQCVEDRNPGLNSLSITVSEDPNAPKLPVHLNAVPEHAQSVQLSISIMHTGDVFQ